MSTKKAYYSTDDSTPNPDNTITLNYVPYQTKIQPKKTLELSGDCRGLCDFENTTIYLAEESPPMLKRQTFFHELFHAMTDQSGFNNVLIQALGDDAYEVYTDNMGRLIYELIYEQKNDIKDIVHRIMNNQ